MVAHALGPQPREAFICWEISPSFMPGKPAQHLLRRFTSSTIEVLTQAVIAKHELVRQMTSLVPPELDHYGGDLTRSAWAINAHTDSGQDAFEPLPVADIRRGLQVGNRVLQFQIESMTRELELSPEEAAPFITMLLIPPPEETNDLWLPPEFTA